MKRMMLAGLLSAVAMAGCAEESAAPSEEGALSVSGEDVTKVEPGKADSSLEAVFLNFDFEGELVTDSRYSPEAQIEKQMLYTMGQLNGDNSVGRLDKVELSEVKTEDIEAGGLRISYEARLLVAWGDKDDVPEQYTFRLPRDVSFSGLDKFADAYGQSCVDWGAHDVDSSSMWYYYRPAASRCDLAQGDVVEMKASVSVSEINTTGKYPEYDKVWEDEVFNVLAVFGKYKDGATSASDAGISAYNNFSRLIQQTLSVHDLKTTPEAIPGAPGVDNPELSFEATLADGRKVVVTALLVDNVRTAGADFNARYGELSRDADLITYNGHAGLGANVRALARKGEWITGQYAIVFMNGCDTYAYVDSALFDAHAEVNDDDDEGTKYLDLVTNAMPSFFRSMPRATMAMIQGLMAYDEPLTYEQIFRDIDKAQVVLVSGEQDNAFVPGGDAPGEPVAAWGGLEMGGEVARGEEKRFETPELPAGTYRFIMSGTKDADLYVRLGLAPTSEKYDCRPYKAGSQESCQLTLSSPAVIHGMVRGWSDVSSFELVGEVAPQR